MAYGDEVKAYQLREFADAVGLNFKLELAKHFLSQDRVILAVNFHWEFDTTHTRSIVINTGWKISLDIL